MNIDEIENYIYNECFGTNMEYYEAMDIADDDIEYGIEINLFDYLNKITDFESDVEALLSEIDKKLDEDYLFTHHYEEFNDVDEEGYKFSQYHCFIKIYKKK